MVVVALLLLAVPSPAQGDDLVVVGYNIASKQMVVSYPRQAARFRGDPEALRQALTRMKIFAEFVATQHPAGANVFAAAGKQTVDVPVPGSNRKNRETVCYYHL
ncbi:MAG: hypothetical protein DYG88_08325 [Chloroflexi bacterium CFX4]|nr:hypothetical protein [Chloroflexi bacterium CFX4]